MKNEKQHIQSSARDGFGLTIPLLLLISVLPFSNQLYGILGENNYLTIHLLLEIFIIIASFTIAIQSWLTFPYILSNHRLYIGALFLSVGLLTLIHTLSYTGMSFFIQDSSAYSTIWFYMASRLTQALGLLLILTSKSKKVHFMQRIITYSLACLYAFVWLFLVYSPYELIPDLMIEGVGTTPLKNGIQYLIIMSQCLLILYLWRNFYKDQHQNTIIIMASVYLILSDWMFTTYQNVYDIKNFIGHIFQLSGFYFLMRTFYSISVEKPFQSLIETQKQLKQSEESLHYMAYHDELTGLPNARFLTEELTRELNMPKTKKAIMMIDIDRLKSINESLGHSFIDLMLQEVANRLRASLSSDLFISQIGRGEFAIILHSVNDHEDVVKVCKQIQEGMKEPFQLQHFLLNITLNIGIAVYPKHGTNQKELLKHAQVAMHEAQKVTDRYVFYHSKMGQQLVERLVLEQDLHYALDNGEIYLEYQPQVNLRTGSIDSVETLVRWNHPEKGLISPAAFIPIAEETGLIVPIGEWVLETACRQAKQWHNEGISHIGIAVNLSTGQFFQKNLVEMVEDILVRTNLPAHYLELEITESMTVDTNHMTEILHDLKQLGVKIAVDDFGTGYSSMYYLKKFPIDCLKIDRSFVRNVQSNHHDDVLISMMISMAKHLELKVVAEGVEETGQLSFLADRDCDIIQGYLFSKPIDPEELSANFDTIQRKVLSLTQLKEVV